MNVEKFLGIINADFYTGVPDSQLKALCNCLISTYGIDREHHIIAANEGNSVALAAGHYLATGKYALVYMQNSGEGNVINPVASLINEKVYSIPMVFVVGWRGEPGVHDEPQHVFQGEVTLKLLEDMDIEAVVIDSDDTVDTFSEKWKTLYSKLKLGKQVAVVVRKGALSYDEKVIYSNDNVMKREEIIKHIVKYSGEDPIVSTTGKASRELFEIRERQGQSHKYDFLTVGSMGHSSSIALGVALSKPDTRIWCVDGDGAALMHMGAMAVIGNNKPNNLIHIIINNEAHETVGGMPTVSNTVDYVGVAKSCGYPEAVCVDTFDQLDCALSKASTAKELTLIVIKSSIGARDNLGRPTTSPIENRNSFMDYMSELD